MPDYNDVAMSDQPLQVPLSDDALATLARRCGLHSGLRVLDLSCYRGHLLNTWARDYDLRGTGVDERPECINIAQTRANELNVWTNVQYVVADVFEYPQPFHEYNLITWLTVGAGLDLPRWLAVMRTALRDRASLILVGESYWKARPSRAALKQKGIPIHALPQLDDLRLVGEQAGLALVDMLLLDHTAWDEYYAQQWRTVARWLRDHPDDADAPEIRRQWQASQRQYLSFEREAVGYGVFVYSPI